MVEVAFSFPYQEATFGLVVIGTIIGLIATIIGVFTWRASSSDRRTRRQDDETLRDLEDNPFERLQCWIKKADPPVSAQTALSTALNRTLLHFIAKFYRTSRSAVSRNQDTNLVSYCTTAFIYKGAVQ